MVNIRGLKEKLLPVLVLGSALLLSDFLVGSAATAAAGYRGVNAGAESVPGQESSLKTAGTDSGAGSADASDGARGAPAQNKGVAQSRAMGLQNILRRIQVLRQWMSARWLYLLAAR